MLIELNQQEHALLLDILGSALGTLREEIYKTENMDFEQGLKQRESVLIGLLEVLRGAKASGLAIGEPTTPR